MIFDVAMYENDRVITVRLRARGEQDAIRKAEALCPNAVTLAADKQRRQSK